MLSILQIPSSDRKGIGLEDPISREQPSLPPKGGGATVIVKVISAVKDAFIAIKDLFVNLVTYVSKNLTTMCARKDAPTRIPAKFEGVHNQARSNSSCYPFRFVVPVEKVSWDVPWAEYTPPVYTGKGWTTDLESSKSNGEWCSHQGVIRCDAEGFSLNPCGRTGLAGRGLLRKLGANQLGHPVVTRLNPENQELEILLYKCQDTGDLQLPSGSQPPGEFLSLKAKKALSAVTDGSLDDPALSCLFTGGLVLFQGYLDNSRNTDHAWQETTAIHVHLPPDQARQCGKLQCPDVAWHPITKSLVDDLPEGDSSFVQLMQQNLDQKILTQCTNRAEVGGRISFKHLLTLMLRKYFPVWSR